MGQFTDGLAYDPADWVSASNLEERRAQLREGLERTRERIAQLASDAGRPAPRLLPVTKFHPAIDVALLAELGVRDVAENREQEARAKAEQLPGVRFHMIGQVQTKKANHVARWATTVHSLDSGKLARALERGVALARERGERDAALPVYVQVSTDSDAARGGVALGELSGLIAQVEEMEELQLRGLMVVPPVEAEPTAVFSQVRELADSWGTRLGRALELSAGMSGDLDAAVFSGTDIVRVGTGIMGPRKVR